jgi:hypothetical protein
LRQHPELEDIEIDLGDSIAEIDFDISTFHHVEEMEGLTLDLFNYVHCEGAWTEGLGWYCCSHLEDEDHDI